MNDSAWFELLTNVTTNHARANVLGQMNKERRIVSTFMRAQDYGIDYQRAEAVLRREGEVFSENLRRYDLTLPDVEPMKKLEFIGKTALQLFRKSRARVIEFPEIVVPVIPMEYYCHWALSRKIDGLKKLKAQLSRDDKPFSLIGIGYGGTSPLHFSFEYR